MAEPKFRDLHLVEDGAMSFEEVVVDRFYATVTDPATAETYRTYGYVFQNFNPLNRHRVVPLLPLRRTVQHGMSIRDAAGRALVQLDSSTGAVVAARHAELLTGRINEHLGNVNLQKLRIPAELLGRIARPPIFSKTEKDDQLAALHEALMEIRSALGSVGSEIILILDRFGAVPKSIDSKLLRRIFQAKSKGEAGRLFTQSETPLGVFLLDIQRNLPRLGAAGTSVSRLLQIIEKLRDLAYVLDSQRTHFTPFAILHSPLAASKEISSTSLAYVSQTVRDRPSFGRFVGYFRWFARNYKRLRTTATRIVLSLAFVVLLTTVSLRSIFDLLLQVVLGWHRAWVKMPLNKDAASSHFRIDVPKGARVLYQVWPPALQGVPRATFLRHNYEDAWEAREENSYTFYRQRKHVDEYRRLVGESEASVRVIARENWTTWIISLLMVLFSIITFLDFVSPNSVPGGKPYLAAPVTMAVTLAIFSYDKPFLRRPILLRIGLALGLILIGIWYASAVSP